MGVGSFGKGFRTILTKIIRCMADTSFLVGRTRPFALLHIHHVWNSSGVPWRSDTWIQVGNNSNSWLRHGCFRGGAPTLPGQRWGPWAAGPWRDDCPTARLPTRPARPTDPTSTSPSRIGPSVSRSKQLQCDVQRVAWVLQTIGLSRSEA